MNSIFSLPVEEQSAKQIFYGVMLSGTLFFPMLAFVYHAFIATKIGIETKNFFAFSSFIYLIVFFLVSSKAARLSVQIREELPKDLPKDVAKISTIAAKSRQAKVIKLGEKYWFWQLTGGYFSGVAFSWLFCVFALYILNWA